MGSNRRLYAWDEGRAAASEPTAFASSEPELMRGISKRFRSRLSVAGPRRGTLVCRHVILKKSLMCKPTNPWHQVHRDERESKLAVLTFQWYKDHGNQQAYHSRMRNAAILVK